MRPAVLPKELEETKLLRNMKEGDKAYTMHWAMMVNAEGLCFLNGRYPASPSKGGMQKMLVERHEDGYHVFASETGQKFSRSRIIPWDGATDEDLIPVQAVR